MANLFEKDGKWWINYRINGWRFRQTTGTSNRDLAEAKLKEVELQIFKGQLPNLKTVISQSSLPEFFRRFKDYCRSNYGPNNIHSDLARIQTLSDFFARRHIKTV
ncbi:MAG: hypothetical protein GY855_09490 [candidate division Zixibacteria bacterium]|nr:hypothetical protein [candidate division Zixibacteria bacterium]